jgi:hypothetical protein
MKSGVIKKHYYIILAGNYFLLPIIGWRVGGILPAIVGVILAYLIDIFFPKYQYELTWYDIDLALKNIYQYGNNPCELCFRVKKKKIYVYRDEKGNSQEPIRMAVSMPLLMWKDLYDDGDFHHLIDEYGGKGMYCNNRGPESYVIFPRGGLEGCKSVLRLLFEKAVGGLQPDIYAESTVNSTKNIWLEHQDGETEKQKKRRAERLERIIQQRKEESKQKRYIDEARKEQQAEQKRRRKEREKKIKERRKQKQK